jgi:glycosyltransferase involved in cell wall biosynthesis
MHSTPFFSVIINCHNSELYLQEAIESVINQSFKNFEIIIYDNASFDNTSHLASNYGDKVRYYLSDVKLTLGAARNKAVEKATGKYLAFLDSDDIWVPSKLETQFNAMKNCPVEGVGLCGSDAMRVSSDLTPITKYSLGRLRRKHSMMVSLMHDCFIPMSSTIVSREVCMGLGGFDESFEIIEEWDLWIRIASGFEVIYIDECLVNIRFHSSNTSRNYHSQQAEIMSMFANIEARGDAALAAISSARATWELRYKIIQLFNSSHRRLNQTFKLMLDFTLFSLRRPRVFFSIIRSYCSIRLIQFALVKYMDKKDA